MTTHNWKQKLPIVSTSINRLNKFLHVSLQKLSSVTYNNNNNNNRLVAKCLDALSGRECCQSSFRGISDEEMPALEAFGRSWMVASDDFVYPATEEALANLVWILMTSIVFATHNIERTCLKNKNLELYVLGCLIQLVFTQPVLAAIVYNSSLGTILDVSPRWRVVPLLYTRLFLLIVSSIWDVLGSVWISDDILMCDITSPTVHVVLLLVVCNWLKLAVACVCAVVFFDPVGSLRSSGGYSQHALRRSVSARSVWLMRCRVMFCLVREDRATPLLNDIAGHVASLAGDEDLVPSDILAGLILLAEQHTAAASRLHSVTSSRLHSVTSSERQAVVDCNNTVDTATQSLSDTVSSFVATSSPSSSSPGVVMRDINIGTVRNTPSSHTAQQQQQQPQHWMTPRLAAHYMRYCLAIYGCCFQLADSCRLGRHSNDAGGRHSNHTAGRHSNDTGGRHSNDTAGRHSNHTAGRHSNDTGGRHSNDTGGRHSNDTAGRHSNHTAGRHSNDTGGRHSNDTAGRHSNDAGGRHSNDAACIVDFSDMANQRYHGNGCCCARCHDNHVVGSPGRLMMSLWQRCVCCGTCRRNRSPLVQGDNCCLCNTAAVQYCAGLHEDDIVHLSFDSSLYRVAFMVAVDHSTQSIVVCIRGTLSLADTLTGLTINSVNIDISDQFRVHKGMWSAAQYVHCQLMETNALRRASQLYPLYGLTITGQSLGGGTAALLSVLLKPQYPHLQCFAFSPPGGLVSAALADCLNDHVATVVCGDDIVPRLSYSAVLELKRHLLSALSACRLSKYQIMYRACYKYLCGDSVVTQQHDSTTNNSNSNSNRDWRQPLLTSDCHNNGYESLVDVSERVRQRERMRDEQNSQLFLPGTIMHVSHHGLLQLCDPDDASCVQVNWPDRRSLTHIEVTPSMLTDHRPTYQLLLLQHVADVLDNAGSRCRE